MKIWNSNQIQIILFERIDEAREQSVYFKDEAWLFKVRCNAGDKNNKLALEMIRSNNSMIPIEMNRRIKEIIAY